MKKIPKQKQLVTTDAMGNQLDEEEQWIENHFDEFVPVPAFQEELERYRQYARKQLNKNANINFRLQQKDVLELKKIAAHEGIPYQTLTASIIHKFIRDYKWK